MNALANALIDALGGTAKVAAKSKAPMSTVHSWRKDGLSPSRLDHLVRIAQNEDPPVDLHALAAEHSIELLITGADLDRSSGKTGEISAQAVSA